MAEVFRTAASYRFWREACPADMTVGLVPTMGGLHAGHMDLVKRALAENDFVVVSVFLNRTQFNNQEDYEKYPAVFEEDLQLLEEAGVHGILAPRYEEMYPDAYRYKVSESQISLELEGEHRPGHFDGVLTVVLKLLCIAQAHKAYFGEKDWQQLQLVKGMAEAFFLPVDIVACPTVREESGLAMSSRNRRLSPEGLVKAGVFNHILNTATDESEAVQALQASGFEVEYVADREGRRLGAVMLEGVRLIDNVARESAVQS